MLKSFLAVVAGYLVFGVSAVSVFYLSGQRPGMPASVTFMIGSTACGTLFAFLGGVVAAWLAPFRPKVHVSVVAGIIGVAAAASLAVGQPEGELWSPLAALLLMAPAVLAGGWLFASRIRK